MNAPRLPYTLAENFQTILYLWTQVSHCLRREEVQVIECSEVVSEPHAIPIDKEADEHCDALRPTQSSKAIVHPEVKDECAKSMTDKGSCIRISPIASNSLTDCILVERGTEEFEVNKGHHNVNVLRCIRNQFFTLTDCPVDWSDKECED